jgi:hypothetical protein
MICMDHTHLGIYENCNLISILFYDSFRFHRSSSLHIYERAAENSFEIIKNNEIIRNFEDLSHLPLRDHNDFYTLEDIELSNFDELAQKYINLLFVIREVGLTFAVLTFNCS